MNSNGRQKKNQKKNKIQNSIRKITKDQINLFAVLHPAAGGYPNIAGAANAQYRQPQAGGVRQQSQGGQGAQAAGIRNSARPITGQQQAVQVRKYKVAISLMNV